MISGLISWSSQQTFKSLSYVTKIGKQLLFWEQKPDLDYTYATKLILFNTSTLSLIITLEIQCDPELTMESWHQYFFDSKKLGFGEFKDTVIDFFVLA